MNRMEYFKHWDVAEETGLLNLFCELEKAFEEKANRKFQKIQKWVDDEKIWSVFCQVLKIGAK